MAITLDTRELSTNWFVGTRRRRLVSLTALAVALSLGFARLVLTVDIAAVAVLAIAAALIAIAIQPRYGLYLMFAIVLFFDGISLDPVMRAGEYINFSLQTTLHLNGAILIPFEMLVLL